MIPDVLASRYASAELARLFSPEHKVVLWSGGSGWRCCAHRVSWVISRRRIVQALCGHITGQLLTGLGPSSKQSPEPRRTTNGLDRET